jgi:TolA-binding protein
MLKPKKRLTKKELKEDKLVTFYYQASSFFESHRMFIYGVTLGLIVLIAAFYYLNRSSSQATEESSLKFYKARQVFERGNFGNSIEVFEELVSDYSGTRYGKLGRFYLAQSYFNTGEYQKADEQFEEFVSSYNDMPHLLAAAWGGQAACAEAQDQWAEAARLYEKGAKKYPDTVFIPAYYLKAAQAYRQAGESDTAKALCQKIINDYETSEEVKEAKMLLQMIETAD